MKRPVASRADLVRVLTGAPDVCGFVAEQLGLECQPTTPNLPEPEREFEFLHEIATSEKTQPLPRDIQPRPSVSFWQAIQFVDRSKAPLAQAPEIFEKESDVESPTLPVVVEPFTPLASFTEIFTRLRHQAALERPGHQIDLERLVSDLSQARDLVEVPRLNRRIWGDNLHVVIDLSRRLIPYREDQREVARQLKRLLPSSGASISILRHNHQVPLIQWPDEQEGLPLDPVPGDTILALSDLGILDQISNAAEKTWECLGQSWLDQRCSTIALLPCRLDRLPKRMADLWSPVQWDRFSSDGSEPTEEESLGARERLLSLLSQAIRIEPQLVRVVRRLFAEGKRDPGLESLVWQVFSAENADHCSAATFSHTQADQIQHDLASDDLARQAWRVIHAFHQAEYEGVRFAESANLQPEAWQWLSRAERHQTREWFESLWKELQATGKTEDERAEFFIRVSSRLSEDAFKKLPTLHKLQHRLCPNDEPPRGYDPGLAGAEVEGQITQTIQVSQVAGELEYRRRGDFPQRSSPLATIRLKNPEIVIDSFDDLQDAGLEDGFWLDGSAPQWADRWGRDEVGPWVEFVVGDARQRMRWIPPGEFLMGSLKKPESEGYPETPQQPVTISHGFWLFDTSCTQALWEAVMGENPSHFKGSERPVENVSWDDCQEFHKRVEDRCPGLALTLPTEAEWEYACRAGTKADTYAGDGSLDEVAWNSESAGRETHPVGKLRPNAFGLHDMLGNVWEWCRDQVGRKYVLQRTSDPFHETGQPSAYRVVRGGSWCHSALYVRAASRSGYHPAVRGNYLGFRCSSSGSEPSLAGRRPRSVVAERSDRGRSRRGAGGDSEPESEDRLVRIKDRDAEYAPVPQGPVVRLRTDLEEVFLCRTLRPHWATRMGRDAYGLWSEFAVPRQGLGDVIQRLRWIPPGRFLMGSPDSEKGRFKSEGPQHEAIVAEGFWLFDTPCTQALWDAVMGENPSKFRGERRPVEQVDWNQAIAFTSKLSEVVGLSLQLPSEVDWEYACRAGSAAATYAGDFDPDDHATQEELQKIAWYNVNAPDGTHDVGTLRCNAWGLYDMLGNVLEWCRDTWSSGYDHARPAYDASSAGRVVRGGCWRDSAQFVRAAYRDGDHPWPRIDILGFRCSSSGGEHGLGTNAERSGRRPKAEPAGDGVAVSPEPLFKRLLNRLTGNN